MDMESNNFEHSNHYYNKSTSWVSKFSLKGILILVVTILLAFALIIVIFRPAKTSSSNSQTATVAKSDVTSARETKNISKEFSFPIKNEANVEVSKIKYFIENAQLQDEIIVKGQKATAVKGRTFLIINLKITNSHNQAISINTRDYLRLLVGDSKELLAPDIHNDPVEIQAISTKITRIGFPIDDNNKKFKVQVGEINGEKTTFDLTFK